MLQHHLTYHHHCAIWAMRNLFAFQIGKAKVSIKRSWRRRRRDGSSNTHTKGSGKEKWVLKLFQGARQNFYHWYHLFNDSSARKLLSLAILNILQSRYAISILLIGLLESPWEAPLGSIFMVQGVINRGDMHQALFSKGHKFKWYHILQ